MKNGKSLFEIYKSFFRRYRNSEEEEKQKIIAYIYIILSLFTLCIFGIFAINPTVSTISNLNKQYEDSKAVEKGLDAKLNALRALDQQYLEMYPKISEVVYPAVPDTAQIPYTTRQLETLIKSNNLNLTRVTFGLTDLYPIIKKPTLYFTSFNIIVEGKSEDIINLVSKLSNFDRIITLDRVEITTKTDKETTQGYISGQIYFTK